jgi:Ca-activated chloride channel family protein
MSFERPWALLVLLALPAALLLYAVLRRRPAQGAVRYPNLAIAAAAAGSQRPWRAWATTGLLALALAALCVAVARPHVNRVVADERATVVLVLDVSRSMLSDDVRPTRLEAAKAAAEQFLDVAPGKLRVGLVTFSGDVTVASPPTRDHERIRLTIRQIGPYDGFGGGTAIGDAVARAVEVGQDALQERELASALQQAAPAQGEDPRRSPVSILFLSDGRQNRGILPPLEGAARATAAGFPVYTVALGTNGGGGSFGGFRRAPDPETLRAIAKATGGEFFAARTPEALSSAYTDLGSRLGRTPRRSEATVAFVGIGAAALLAAFVLGAWWAPRLP